MAERVREREKSGLKENNRSLDWDFQLNIFLRLNAMGASSICAIALKYLVRA